MFASPLPPMIMSFLPHTEIEFLCAEKAYRIQKSLIFFQFHVAKIVSITPSFTGYVRMMQMYFYVNDSMKTFK